MVEIIGMHPRSRTETNVTNVAEEIIDIIESVKAIREYRKTQMKECASLVKGLKLFLPLFEKIRGTTISAPGTLYLKNLRKAFLSAKKLLMLCHEGSKIYLASESEALTLRFHTVYRDISQAMEGMPHKELGISEEEKERVELLRSLLKTAKKRREGQDTEVTMDLMVALSTSNDINADLAIVERLANKLCLRTPEELNQETLAIRKLVKESSESQQQIVNLLNKFKMLAAGKSRPTIPMEFLCPITCAVMWDPVTIATGQTYERESIERWLDSNHRTCPKTGQILSHMSLSPNYNLKKLIFQWREKNNFFPQQKEEDVVAPAFVSTEDPEIILSLVKDLSSSNLDKQREAVAKIRHLSKSFENRALIIDAGGTQLLAQLVVSCPDSMIQGHAATSLYHFSNEELRKKTKSKENAATTLMILLGAALPLMRFLILLLVKDTHS